MSQCGERAGRKVVPLWLSHGQIDCCCRSAAQTQWGTQAAQHFHTLKAGRHEWIVRQANAVVQHSVEPVPLSTAAPGRTRNWVCEPLKPESACTLETLRSASCSVVPAGSHTSAVGTSVTEKGVSSVKLRTLVGREAVWLCSKNGWCGHRDR